jgi:hypothetical protein
MTDGNGPVGYKRPPVNTRFQPGRSGNPRGRPKTRPSFRAALLAELDATMPAKNQQQAGSKLQALVRALVNAAVAGDARSQALLVGALLRFGESEENEAASLASDDQAANTRVAPTEATLRQVRAMTMRTELHRPASLEPAG